MPHRVSRALGVAAATAFGLLAARAVAANASGSLAAPDAPAFESVRGESPRSSTEVRDKGGPEKRPEPRERLKVLGATFDVGFPDGAILGVAARPASWLRLAMGAGTNAISPGIRGGLALIPFGTGPSAIIEGGYYFDGNANSAASLLSGSSWEDSRMAARVGYEFMNLHGGLELGQERLTFYAHGGMSYIHSELHSVNDVLGGSSANTTITTSGSPVLTAWVPSLKLGFIFYVV